MSKDTAGLIPRSYVITLDGQAKDRLVSLNINATPIITSAAFFVQELKKKLVEDKFMIPDQNYDIFEGYSSLSKEHEKLSELGLDKHPDSIYSLFYQDGIKHAFERLTATKNSGENSCIQQIINVIKSYDILIKERLRKRNYFDIAYLKGYQSGLAYFLANEDRRRSLPMYFLLGYGLIPHLDEYLKLERKASKFHKSAHNSAEKLVRARVRKGLVFHHKPFA